MVPIPLNGPKFMRIIETELNKNDCDPNTFNVDEIMHKWEAEDGAGISQAKSNLSEYSFEDDKPYYCDYNNCFRRYTSISHLNSHRKRKQHGPPKKKADYDNKHKRR